MQPVVQRELLPDRVEPGLRRVEAERHDHDDRQEQVDQRRDRARVHERLPDVAAGRGDGAPRPGAPTARQRGGHTRSSVPSNRPYTITMIMTMSMNTNDSAAAA